VNQFPWQVAIEIKDGKLPTLILQDCFLKNLLPNEFFERQNQQAFFLHCDKRFEILTLIGMTKEEKDLAVFKGLVL